MSAARACGVIVLVLASVGSGQGGAKPCHPSFAALGDEPVESVEGNVRMQLNGAVIGCESDLASVTEPERGRLRTELARVLEEEHYYLIGKARDKAFRAVVATRMNRRLGRAVVTDVFLYGFGTEESFHDEPSEGQ